MAAEARVKPIPVDGRVVAEDLPGNCLGPERPVLVGVQRGNEVEQVVAATRPRAELTFDVGVLHAGGDGDDGDDGVDRGAVPDFRGPYVHGRRNDRFLYLVWGHPDDDVAATGDDRATGAGFVRFARSKLMFSELSPAVLRAALDDPATILTCTLRASNDAGQPASGTLRPPFVDWTAERRVAGG